MSYLALAQKIIAERGLASAPQAVAPSPETPRHDGGGLEAGALGPDPSDWPPWVFSRWAARAALLEAAEGLTPDEADRRAADEINAEMVHGPAEPWVWTLDDDGPFRVAGDAPPSTDRPDLVARALVAVAAMNRLYADDDAGVERLAEELEAVLAELRRTGVRVWLAS